MNDLKYLAERLAALRALREVVHSEENAAKAELESLMKESGVRSMEPQDPSHQRLAGTITLTAGRRTAYIADGRAFLNWVKARHPQEIVEIVNPAFEEKLKRDALATGMGFDQTTGERLDFIEIRAGEQYLMVKLAPESLAEARDWVPMELGGYRETGR